MGLANNKGYKQESFILFFPMYVCLGAFFILKGILSPIIMLNNKMSKKDTNISSNKNVNMNATLNTNKPKKTVNIDQNMEKSREELLNSIDSGEETRSNNVVTYRYTALDPNGKKVTNTFYALSKVEVYTFLENEGYQVFKIETSKLIEILYGNSAFGGRKIKKKDIVFWLQQLSTYLKSGIPLTDSMRILTKQMSKNNNIKITFDSIVYYLTLGESFSTALEKQGDAFPDLLINMIKSAEATGDLIGTLDEMAEYYKRTETTRKEMISALTYPALVVVFSIGVVIFLLIFLIPKFVGIYQTAGVKLNPITTFLINSSSFMQSNIFYLLLVILAIIILLIVLYKNVKEVRKSMQVFMMKFPVIGKVIIYKEMMIFTKTFSSLLKNNVFITDSMDLLSKVTNNEIYREIMANSVNLIGSGEKISTAFQNHWAIPDVAYYMMVTGESTGELANMMGKVSDYYAEQHKLIVDSLKTLIEPVLIVILAVIVGGIMIAVIVPLFGLYSEILH